MNIFIRVKLYFSETFPFSKVLKFKWTGILFNDSQLVMFSYTGTLYTNVLLYNNKFCGIFIVSLSLDFVILNTAFFFFWPERKDLTIGCFIQKNNNPLNSAGSRE